MAQISLAWIISKPGVSAPIIGTTNLSNLEDILGQRYFILHGSDHGLTLVQYAAGALEVKLTEEEVKYLEEPYKPMAISGHF